MQRPFAIKLLAITIALIPFGFGCTALEFMGGTVANTITFSEGELQSTSQASFEDLNIACRAAIDALGYEDVETLREEEHMRWQARTAGGEPVEIHLDQSGRNQITLRIRIGMIGNETRSRLVLEEIQKSLAKSAATDIQT